MGKKKDAKKKDIKKKEKRKEKKGEVAQPAALSVVTDEGQHGQQEAPVASANQNGQAEHQVTPNGQNGHVDAPAASIAPVAEADAPTTPSLRERQSQLKLKYKVRPDSALITSSVSSVTEEGQDPRQVRIAVDGPSGVVLDIGAHAAVGGFDELPCSGDIFLASLAACQELTIRLVAAALNLPIHKLSVRVEGDWDVRGTLGVLREAPVGFTDLRMNIDLETDGSPERVERLLKSAERFCVVSETLKNPPALAINANVTNPQAEVVQAGD
jgi:uncharacterized OsmC-like protein